MVAAFDQDRLHVLQSSLVELNAFVEHALRENPCLDYDATSDDVEQSCEDKIPDVVLKPGPDGKYVARAEAGDRPKLHVNSTYSTMLEDPTLDPAARSFVERKVRAAERLIGDLVERQRLLERVGQLIIDTQKAFLD